MPLWLVCLMMSLCLSSALNVKRDQLTNLLESLKGLQNRRVPQHGIKKITITHDADGDDDGTYEKYDINIQEPKSSRYPSPTWKSRTTESATTVNSNQKEASYEDHKEQENVRI